MSHVAITDLIPGEEATSADVNATIASWNAAAGAGDIGPNNVRQEGLDRRTLSLGGQAIQAPPAAFVNCIESGATATVNAVAAAWAIVDVGPTLYIGPMTDLSSTSSETVVVRASLWFQGAALDAALDPALYEFILQSSADASAWVDYDESYQAFQVTDWVSLAGTDSVSYCVGVYTAVVATTPAGSRVYWRVAYRATQTVTCDSGTLYIEEYAR
jgi:hypothetical protein